MHNENEQIYYSEELTTVQSSEINIDFDILVTHILTKFSKNDEGKVYIYAMKYSIQEAAEIYNLKYYQVNNTCKKIKKYLDKHKNLFL